MFPRLQGLVEPCVPGSLIPEDQRTAMAQQLTIDEISQVAFLARLELSEAEKRRMTDQLNDLMAHFARIDELDTNDVPPTSHSVPMVNVFRDDVARPCLPREAATANAPEKRDGNFIVPQIVEG